MALTGFRSYDPFPPADSYTHYQIPADRTRLRPLYCRACGAKKGVARPAGARGSARQPAADLTGASLLHSFFRNLLPVNVGEAADGAGGANVRARVPSRLPCLGWILIVCVCATQMDDVRAAMMAQAGQVRFHVAFPFFLSVPICDLVLCLFVCVCCFHPGHLCLSPV